ncbi:DUF3307 domain-containing protein [Flavobacterium sp. NST-5]|uniref:DUF3307 domain-containing protein n=1 Tax=Flavobacterium ichthyis TaxID=2698827 RepID=A0ABW9Z5A6_9FLAO|nr:DUF3307 domain-containing protein [Flavobacterium ichthyis]NBL64026.1 DUF3307 domain-containing protein [Flavobacterium ichthyis]
MVFIQLLIAHFVGDFLLQPNSWIKHKIAHKEKSIYLIIHCILHGMLSFLWVFDTKFIPYAFAIIVLHFIIDVSKLRFQTPKSARLWFFLDQFFHLIVLAAVTYFYSQINLNEIFINYKKLWIIILGIVFLSKPTSLIIKTLISIWTPEEADKSGHSLQSAGNYIGILERWFILCFILTGHFEAVGFLLGAKSIFRFGDLRMARDRKLTEYVLIGTLLSFGIAIGVSLLTQTLLQNFSVYFLD